MTPIEQAIEALQDDKQATEAEIERLSGHLASVNTALDTLVGLSGHFEKAPAPKKPKKAPAKKKTAGRGGTIKGKFPCKHADCERVLSTAAARAVHEKSHKPKKPRITTAPAPSSTAVDQPVEEQPEPDGNHRCFECGSQFESRTWLLSHRRKTGHDVDGADEDTAHPVTVHNPPIGS